MLCTRKARTSTTKVFAKQETASHKIPKTIYGCIVEPHESTRQRVESSLLTKHEDHIAGKGFLLRWHTTVRFTKFILLLQATKIPDAKAAVDKEWKKLETIPAWHLEKVKFKKEVILKTQRDKKKVHFATLMNVCHLKMRSWNHNYRSIKAESCSGDTL